MKELVELRRAMNKATARPEIRSLYIQNHDPSRSEIQSAIRRYWETERRQLSKRQAHQLEG